MAMWSVHHRRTYHSACHSGGPQRRCRFGVLDRVGVQNLQNGGAKVLLGELCAILLESILQKLENQLGECEVRRVDWAEEQRVASTATPATENERRLKK